MRPTAFLDRDGVINIDHGYVARREDFRFVPGVLAACAELHRLGYALVVITNQSGIGRGLYTAEDFRRLTRWMQRQFEQAGAPLAGVYFCPHHPTDAAGEHLVACRCRKPAPGMLLDAIRDLRIDPARSVLFGDKHSDLQAAQSAGIGRRVLLGTDGAAPPPEAEDGGLATARFRSLADALSDPAFRTSLAESVRA